MKILVTRHGQTDWNVLRKLQGQTDIELNSTGRLQAEEAGKMIKNEEIDLVITSPLKRAKETAQIINKFLNVKIIEDERLKERGFGGFEGITLDDYEKQKETNLQAGEIWNYPQNVNFNNVEPMHDFFARIYDFFDEITEKYNGKNILIVSHGATSVPINCYFEKYPLEQFLGRDKVRKLGNCETWKFKIC